MTKYKVVREQNEWWVVNKAGHCLAFFEYRIDADEYLGHQLRAEADSLVDAESIYASMRNVQINCRHPEQVGRLLAEYALPETCSITIEADGCRGGWTVSLLTKESVPYWRKVGKSLLLDPGAVW